MSDSVLVTGGGGFIGTWVLRELLARGLRPVVLDLAKNDERWKLILGANAARVTFYQGGLQDRALLAGVAEEHRITHIIHLAALLTPQCQQDPYLGCEVNVLGSAALFELARMREIRGFSYASSYAVYGPEADDSPNGLQAADNRPPSFYGAYKLAVDLMAEQYWRHFGVASLGVRPHVAFGPERTLGLTAGPSLACRAAANGETFTINYNGRLGYDFVEDVATAFVRGALETPAGWNVVDLPNEPIETADFAAAIGRAAPGAKITINGPAVPANTPPKPRYVSELFPDWRMTSLDEGVRKTVDFYRAQKERSA